MSQERKHVDIIAVGVMLLLTALWGFQQVTVKWIAADVSLVMQAALRSIIATVLLLGWARLRGLALLLFAFEFVLIYAGLAHTNASRMSVFIYLAPPLTWRSPSPASSPRSPKASVPARAPGWATSAAWRPRSFGPPPRW